MNLLNLLYDPLLSWCLTGGRTWVPAFFAHPPCARLFLYVVLCLWNKYWLPALVILNYLSPAFPHLGECPSCVSAGLTPTAECKVPGTLPQPAMQRWAGCDPTSPIRHIGQQEMEVLGQQGRWQYLAGYGGCVLMLRSWMWLPAHPVTLRTTQYHFFMSLYVHFLLW